MESTRLLRKLINLIRYDKPQNSIPFFCVMIVLSFTAIESFMVALYEMNDQKRVAEAVKDTLLMICGIYLLIDWGLFPEKSLKLITLIEGNSFVNKEKLGNRVRTWGRVEKILYKKKARMEWLYKTIRKVILVIFIGVFNRHFFDGIKTDKPILRMLQEWPTPFAYYSPSGYSFWKFNLAMHIIQSLFLIPIFMAQFLVLQVSVGFAIERIVTDFETIFILLDDKELQNGNITKQSLYQDCVSTNEFDEKSLAKYMGLIVQFHQDLNRNCNESFAYLGHIVFYASSVMGIETCIDIYVILKTNDQMVRLSSAAILISINLMVFYTYYVCQRVVNQNDNFRQSLASVVWIDKPEWFKKALLLMMSRAGMDTHISTSGVYILDLTYFKNYLKAAYSFASFLHTT